MATLVLEHSDRVGSDRLGEVLRDHGHRLDVRRLHSGDPLPPDLDNIDAIVTCGGPHSALDDSLPWMAAEMDLLREAHARAMPIVGLCLGSQLLARALGGTVEPLEGGVELGWQEVALSPVGREDPIYAGIPWKTMQPHWHSMHVAAAPTGARVLARSERTPIQAYAVGLRTYGIQYHPEIHVDRLDQWADDEPSVLRDAKISRETLRDHTRTNYATCARLANRLFEAMALLLMPLDRRYAGVSKDLHH